MANRTRKITSHRLSQNGINDTGIRIDFIHRSPVNREVTEMQRATEVVRQAIASLLGHETVDEAGDPRNLARVRCPILLIHGDRDEVSLF